jgi:hypothetical protein
MRRCDARIDGPFRQSAVGDCSRRTADRCGDGFFGCLLGAGLGLPADPSGGPSVPRLDRVFVIMMENTSYSDLLNQANPNTTFVQSLAENYGLATHYYGVTHPSLPNYVAAISGSNWARTRMTLHRRTTAI